MLSQHFKWSLAIAAVLVIGGAAVRAQIVVPIAPQAETQTLELIGDSTTSPVHYNRYGYRNYRPYYGYSYSYYRPRYNYSYYRPRYSYSYSYYRPRYGYSYSYYRPRYYGYSSYSYYRPYSSCYYYRPICDDIGAIVVTLGDCPSTLPAMPYVPENPPKTNPQEPNAPIAPDGKKKQFPYDGGPKQPVPFPSPDKQEKPATNPQAPGGGGFLVSFPSAAPQSGFAFRAYGENDPPVVTEPSIEPEPAAPVSRVAPPNPPFEYPAFGEQP